MREGSGTLTTAEAASFLRVSPSTLKRWADDGLVRFERTSGGHRRFHRSDLERLAGAPETIPDDPVSWANALANSDEPLQIQGRLFELRARAGSWWAAADQLVPVLLELRRRRDRGLVTVLQYQQASVRLQRTISATLAHVPRAVDAPVALLTSVSPSEPVVALVLLEICLAEDGWRTRFAGPATAKQIADDVDLRRPDALIVGGQAPEEQHRLMREVTSRGGGRRMGLAFFGIGEACAERSFGITHLHRFEEARTWIANVDVGNVDADVNRDT